MRRCVSLPYSLHSCRHSLQQKLTGAFAGCAFMIVTSCFSIGLISHMLQNVVSPGRSQSVRHSVSLPSGNHGYICNLETVFSFSPIKHCMILCFFFNTLNGFLVQHILSLGIRLPAVFLGTFIDLEIFM